MPNKEKALLRILRQLNGKGVEEVADHILALFNAPPRWKPEDQQEVYTVSDCGEIRAATFRHGEHHSEALWAFGNCFKSKKDAARTREAIEQLLMTFHTQQKSLLPSAQHPYIEQHILEACTSRTILPTPQYSCVTMISPHQLRVSRIAMA